MFSLRLRTRISCQLHDQLLMLSRNQKWMSLYQFRCNSNDSKPRETIDNRLSLVVSHNSSPSFLYNHHMDTFNFVQQLKAAGFSNEKSEAIMDVTSLFILENIKRGKMSFLSIANFENYTYLFKTALAELRSEKIYLRKDQISSLRAGLFSSQRQVEALEQTITEQLNKLSADWKMDFETRKNEARSDNQNIHAKTQELSNRLAISLGNLRAEIEKQKWEQMRRASGVILIFMAFVLMSLSFGTRKTETKNPPTPNTNVASSLDRSHVYDSIIENEGHM
ncbi:fungal protein [Schizosaccharomyces japonicus yFS275]|uniref:Fungal protein n=1 Tax=Schizosaccharomyces japonicus (strain yFS275 / FY16936) TaxID=402676 RepID=B6K4E9_SCHJY|nr:fungal protein [Schizosaccharomyces japonicus yFS275]EEB08356.1 fungal protein [Schizosaccharomyces japonicus yFS275]